MVDCRDNVDNVKKTFTSKENYFTNFRKIKWKSYIKEIFKK